MIEIGNCRELFVDRFLVERLEGCDLRLHQPIRRETALRFDQPWEGSYCAYATVFPDGDIFRLYYRGWPENSAAGDNAENQVYCCAESADGIVWRRPNYRLFECQGSKDNNIMLSGAGRHNFAPWPDERPGVAAAQRFKALGGTGVKGKKGLLAFASADGVHWKTLSDEPVITQGAFDSQNVAFWSTAEGCYVAYFRVWTQAGEDLTQLKGGRTIGRATSEDFLHWSETVRMDYGDAPFEEFYTNQTFPYFRASHIYVALPKRFVPGRRVLSDEQAQKLQVNPKQLSALSDGCFMTSRGGNRYDRTFLEAFFRGGLDEGNWAARGNMAARGCIQTGPDEMSLYYGQHYAQPSAFLVRCSLRLDGFASLHAGYPGGRMVTRPFTFAGGELEMNISTSAAGSIRVELQDETGRPFMGFKLEDCQEIYGDAIEHVVRWKGGADVSGLAGKPVRLRIDLKDADVYSFRFR